MSKIKITLILGFIEVILLSGLRMVQNGRITTFGMHALTLGSKKIIIKEESGFQFMDEAVQIKEKYNFDQEFLFVLFRNDRNIERRLFADYLIAGEYDSYQKVMDFMEHDTTLVVLRKNIVSSYLSFVFIQKGDSMTYNYSRYINCYPYYLRLRTTWIGSKEAPKYIEEALNCIEVTK